MHRAIAAWLTEHRWRVVIASALCGVLSQLMLPFTVLACAIPVLTVLHFDARLGLIAAAVGTASAFWIVSSTVPAIMPAAFVAIALLYFGPLVLAMLLKRTGSLNLCFQVSVLSIGVLLTGVYMALPDPGVVWKPLLEFVLEATQASAGLKTQAERDALVAVLARSMWGAAGAFALATVFSTLLLGRWWQSLLSAPGAFGSEYQRLRLGLTLGIAATALFVLSVATDAPLLAALASVAVMALTFQGLAAAHRSRAGGRLKLGWLAAIYLLLVVPLSNVFAMFALAIWGFADNWLRPRRPASL